MRVLVVEDDAELAKSLKALLEEDGHFVDLAGDGDQGETMARDGGYDVIVLDRMLPQKNGTIVVRNLRAAGCRRRC